MSALHACIEGIGVLGPGLPDWPMAARVLEGASRWEPMPTVLPAPASLPSAERRRTGTVVRLSLAGSAAVSVSVKANPCATRAISG